MKTKAPNPYLAGRPIASTSGFFGREDIFEIIRSALIESEQSRSIALFGGRRTGKTSILCQIEGGRLGDQVVPCMINMESFGEISESELLQEVAIRVVDQLGFDESLVTGINWEHGPRAFNAFLEMVIPGLRERVLLIMIDECEKLAELVNTGAMGPSVFDYLKSLSELHGSVALLFTGSHRIKVERERFLPQLLSASDFYQISFLDPDTTEALIRRPAEGMMGYSDEAVAAIYSLTHGHPFFTQLICQKLFLRVAGAGRECCELADVEAVVPEMAENPPPHLPYVWQEELDSTGRLVVAALADIEPEDGRLAPVEEVAERLKEARVPIRPDAVSASLTSLQLQEVVLLGPRCETARLALGFYRYWLLAQHPLAAVAHEEDLAPVWRQRLPLPAWMITLVVCAVLLFSAYGLVTLRSQSDQGITRDVVDAPDGSFRAEPAGDRGEIGYDTPEGWKRMFIEDLGFTIILPAAWCIEKEGHTDQNTGWHLARFTFLPDPSERSTRMVLEVSPGSEGAATQGYEAMNGHFTETYGDEYAVIDTISAPVVGAANAVRWEFTLFSEADKLRKIVQYAYGDGRTCNMVCQTPAVQWARWADVFERTLRSLELIELEPAQKLPYMEVIREYHRSITSANFDQAWGLLSPSQQSRLEREEWETGYSQRVESRASSFEALETTGSTASVGYRLEYYDDLAGDTLQGVRRRVCELRLRDGTWRISKLESDSNDLGSSEQRVGLTEDSQQDLPETLKPYRSTTDGFGISYPVGWEVRQSTYGSGQYRRVTFMEPSGDARILVDCGPPEKTGDVFAEWRDCDRSFEKKHGEGYELVSLKEAAVAGREAASWEYRLREGDRWLQKMDIGFALDDREGYAILCQAPVSRFARLQHLFGRVVASFSLAPERSTSAPLASASGSPSRAWGSGGGGSSQHSGSAGGANEEAGPPDAVDWLMATD